MLPGFVRRMFKSARKAAIKLRNPKAKQYRVTIKETDTFNFTQYQNLYRSEHTIFVVAHRKDEHFFPGILS